MTDALDFKDFIQKHGSNISGTNEYGLVLIDALSAIGIAKDENLPILGGDVYSLISGEIEPAYANWYVNRHPSESAIEYTQRTWNESEKYIKKYPKPDNGSEVLFVLVVGDVQS